ncbi:NAD-dependent epimerase/dehydratase family protein [Chengkuizengella axinellae]|uniref:NAD-dependent epimerase/dehydratase family protein n=1 Tax=Chengkuizengella axinellae TaxID=3064388 RepID=A0ABT9J1L2_9BACL|nr:NAD-dependent epimerase/dehydratase family protein [Chengkuizengella sp. 2205SS18-9]MDP5275500.1 NAD-dependent epimerase/dehydratase family protein [Chengkuizengella sp. 2205SS18-9]
MKKAIVTGANGFIGSHVVKELINQNVEVIAVVRSPKSNLIPLAGIKNIKTVYCDLSDIGYLIQKIKDRDIDTFYHFAWEGCAGHSRTNELIQTQNALWTTNSVKVAKELRCKKFVGAGSIMEKDTFSAVFKHENKPIKDYIYGASKLNAHCLSKTVAAQLDIEHVWGIITNAYGPGDCSPRFINITIRKIIHNEPLVFTKATQIYDFIYITDVAKAFYKIGTSGKPFCNYIIGSSNAKPLKQFIIEMQQTLAPKRELRFGTLPYTGGNISIDQFNTEEIEKDTGFSANISFSEGIIKTMNWYKDNLN